MKLYRKSQAAMEFLMTYGWAILVVLAAIAALAYFGVLSPERLLPEKCVLEPGITCISHKVEPLKASFVISNGKGRTILIDKIEVVSPQTGAVLCSATYAPSIEIANAFDKKFDGSAGNPAALTCDASVGAIREQFRGDVTIKYTEKDTQLQKTAYGNINTKIE